MGCNVGPGPADVGMTAQPRFTRNCMTRPPRAPSSQHRLPLADRSRTPLRGHTATRSGAAAPAVAGKLSGESALDMSYVLLDDRAVADGNLRCTAGRSGGRSTRFLRGSHGQKGAEQ
jgi:hypothetical protein